MRLRHLRELSHISSDVGEGYVNDGVAAQFLEYVDFLHREIDVVQNAIVATAVGIAINPVQVGKSDRLGERPFLLLGFHLAEIAAEIDEQMFVGNRRPQLIRRNGTKHGIDCGH